VVAILIKDDGPTVTTIQTMIGRGQRLGREECEAWGLTVLKSEAEMQRKSSLSLYFSPEAGNDNLNGDEFAGDNSGGFDDYLDVGAGNVQLVGAGGEDVLVGDNESDLLLGNEDDNVLDGGLGNDGLNRGTRDDILYGGARNA
jgi:hypothetical protein